MSNAARERILARLRAAPRLPLPAPVLPAAAAMPEAEMLAAFRRGIEFFHAEVIDARAQGWRVALAEVCRAKAVRHLLLPAGGPQLEDWPDGPRLRRFDQPLETFKAELFADIDAGLTVADGAIADTGTLFQVDPRGTPRTLSLVPPIHVVLLPVRRLYPSLQAAVATEPWQAAMPSNLIFITGPSKTSDIQQTLAFGAHGPRELVVLLTEDAT
jgi:L-lactate dehydrogenase complex protein LldG